MSDWLVSLSPPPLRSLLRNPLGAGPVSPPEAAGRAGRLAVLAAGIVSVSLIVLQIGQEVVLGEQYRMLDADEENNLWTWTHVTAQLSTCFALLLLACQSARARWLWFAAGTMLFLSLDEFLEIHGQIADTLVFFPHAGRVIWPALYFPLLGCLLIVLWRSAEGRHDEVRALVRSGLLLLVLAVGMEVASLAVFVVSDGFGLLYNLEVAIEEGLEGAGWFLIAGGLASAALTAAPVPEPRSANT